MKSLCSGSEFRSGARIKLIGFAAIAALMFAGCSAPGTGNSMTLTPMSKGEISKIVNAPKSYKVVVDTSAVQAGDDEWKKMGGEDIKEFTADIQKEVGDSFKYDEVSPDVVVNVEVKNIQRQSYWRTRGQAMKALGFAGAADIPEMTSTVSLKTKEGDEIEKFESKIVSGWATPLRQATSGHGFAGTGTSHEVYEDFGQMVKEKLTELKNMVLGRK